MRRAQAALDPRLYLVTDPDLIGARDLVEVVLAAVQGGVTLVQLRDKRPEVGEMVQAGRALVAALAPTGVPLLVNDRVDVALAIGAQGAHLGQRDMPLADARRLMGPDAILGLSIERLSEAAAVPDAADYIAASPVFGTPTKTDTAPPLGLEGVAALRAASPLPLVAIGGLSAANAAEVIGAGAQGLAVVSAILGDPRRDLADTRAAAARLRQIIDEAL